MNYTIKSSQLYVTISSKGGELRSILDTSGTEYLWQGDTATWPDRAPNLFPYIGRLTKGSYTFEDKTYHMDIHGFLPYAELKLTDFEENFLVLRLESSSSTLAQYPFNFSLEIQYQLEETSLEITYRVKNCDSKTMYFGIGGHPGFQVPFEAGLTFEDYYLDFGEHASPLHIDISEDCFITGNSSPFPLRNGRYLDLHHKLFDNDAIILDNLSGQITLTSGNGKKAIRVEFPSMKYLGVWHWPKTEVPYVCIEPWSSLPSHSGIVESLKTQGNLISLNANELYENKWKIILTENI